MKRLLVALVLLLLPSVASAQCNGIFPASNVCGTTAAGPGIPGPLPLASFALAPGGTSGQFQVNNGSGGLGGVSLSQDCTATSAGVVTCLKTNNVAFTAAATTPIGTSGATIPLLSANNTWTGTFTQTLNSLTSFTLQDAASSQDTLTFGVNSAAVCDPGYVNGPAPTGQCIQFKFIPFTTDAYGGITLQSAGARVVVASINGASNPEIVVADSGGPFGLPVWGGGGSGGNQSGVGFQSQARTGSGSPAIYNFSNLGATPTQITGSIVTGAGNGKLTVTVFSSGPPIVFGQTFVGSGIPNSGMTITGTASTGSGNCSPACTGTGGLGTYAVSFNSAIGSEAMVGGPSGAEGSTQIGIYGGALPGTTQNVITFFNAAVGASWNSGASGTIAGTRLGELAGQPMTPDGKFTQTETASINFYSEGVAGTFTDGSYDAPSNVVIRLGSTVVAPERITAVFDYNANLLIGANAGVNGFSATANTISTGTNNSLVFYPASGNPTQSPPSGGGLLYTLGGALKYKSGAGTVTTVVAGP